MRVLTGPPVVPVQPAVPEYGTFGAVPVKRERAGYFPGANVIGDALKGGSHDRKFRLLSNDELWLLYLRVPEVRASVDSIVRRISTWDTLVEPVEDLTEEDPLYLQAVEAAETARRFLAAPNADGEVWQTFVSKLVRDLLVFDAWASENVFGRRGELEELVTLPGGDVHPRVDRYQRIVDYVQESDGREIALEREQVVYFNLFPNTRYTGGMPLIESIVNEALTLLNSSRHLRVAFDANEIWPGVLLLAGLGGHAAEQAVADLREAPGADHKLRIITSGKPDGLDGRWVEFRHTPKDLDMAPLMHEVRRCIWRTFGVKPVSQGDTEATPRATAEVQVDAEDSGLIEPILELIEHHINARIIPLLVGSDLAQVVQFAFDRDRSKTPAELESEARTDASDMDRGALTINERRWRRGLLPIDGGDVALVKAGNTYVPLADLLAGDTKDEQAGGDEGDPDGQQDDEAADAAAPDEDDAAPGEVEASRPLRPVVRPGGRNRRGRGRTTLAAMRRAGAPLKRAVGCHPSEPCRGHQQRAVGMPSEWQDDGMFRGYRTLRLSKLARVIVDYSREVEPLYRRAELDVLASFRAYARDGEVTSEDAAALAREVVEAIDHLRVDWTEATRNLYREAAQVGRDAAVHFTGSTEVADGWEDEADNYHAQAMAYLVDAGGLLSDVRSDLVTLIAAANRSAPATAAVRRIQASLRAEGEELDVLALMAAVGRVWERNRHRIANWAGRLVELANNTMSRGMSQRNPAGDEVEDSPGASPDGSEWYVEWVAVGDERTCPTCLRESASGFQPLAQLQRRPGGATECRARCRCVLVYWTRDEVNSGKATRLSGR